MVNPNLTNITSSETISTEQIAKKKLKDKYNQLERDIQTRLNETYSGALSILSSLTIPSQVNPMAPIMPPEQIDAILLNTTRAVIATMHSGDLQSFDLQNDINSAYYETVLVDDIDKMTYAVICASSRYILGLMLFYYDKLFIYNYIKEKIIKPHYIDIINELKTGSAAKDKFSREEQDVAYITENVNNLIQAMMIKLSREITEYVEKIKDKQMENKEDIIKRVIKESKYFVPDFLKDILLLDPIPDELITKFGQFLAKYKISNTKEAVRSLFTDYAENTDSVLHKTDITLLDRNSYHGISVMAPIDGLTAKEVQISNRIVTNTITEDDKLIIDNNEILKNIFAIVQKYKKYDYIARLDNVNVIITDNKKEEHLYSYRVEGVESEINDPFAPFPDNRKFIRARFESSPDTSCLTQTGVLESEVKNAYLAGTKLAVDIMSAPQRAIHRTGQIALLRSKLRGNTELMSEYERLATQPIDKIRYINPLQNTKYVIKDESKLFLILTETEYLYRQIKAKLDNEVTEVVVSTARPKPEGEDE